MSVSFSADHPAFLCPVKKSRLNEERFVYIFKRYLFLAERCCNRIYSYRAASEPFDYREDDVPVEFLQPELINAQGFKTFSGDIKVDITISLDL